MGVSRIFESPLRRFFAGFEWNQIVRSRRRRDFYDYYFFKEKSTAFMRSSPQFFQYPSTVWERSEMVEPLRFCRFPANFEWNSKVRFCSEDFHDYYFFFFSRKSTAFMRSSPHFLKYPRFTLEDNRIRALNSTILLRGFPKMLFSSPRGKVLFFDLVCFEI